jgi:hypothetical protein
VFECFFQEFEKLFIYRETKNKKLFRSSFRNPLSLLFFTKVLTLNDVGGISSVIEGVSVQRVWKAIN